MRRWIPMVGVAAALACAPSVAAQRPVTLGVGGGVAVPAEEPGDGAGWHALATVGWSLPMLPLGFRLDGTHARFDSAAARERVSSATLNATYRLPMTDSPFSPFLVAGAGGYHGECSLGPGCDGGVRFGWNAGLGAKLFLLGFRGFVEARYHRTERGDVAVSYFPLTLGATL